MTRKWSCRFLFNATPDKLMRSNRQNTSEDSAERFRFVALSSLRIVRVVAAENASNFRCRVQVTALAEVEGCVCAGHIKRHIEAPSCLFRRVIFHLGRGQGRTRLGFSRSSIGTVKV